jgi:mono/diheme cytochrome c family protein
MRIVGAAGVCLLIAAMWSAEPAAGVAGASPAAAQKAAGQKAAAPSEVYKDVYNGWKWWHVYCYRCHGTDANGTPNAPNLTDPNEKLSRAAFLKIVRDGLPDQGMQAWNKLLDTKQIGQIHVYVRARADKVLPPGRPDEVGPNGGPWVPPAGWQPR